MCATTYVQSRLSKLPDKERECEIVSGCPGGMAYASRVTMERLGIALVRSDIQAPSKSLFVTECCRLMLKFVSI